MSSPIHANSFFRFMVSQPSNSIVSTWCKSLIYLSRYDPYIPEMSARAENILHFQGGNLSKSNKLCLFQAIEFFASILLIVIAKITNIHAIVICIMS